MYEVYTVKDGDTIESISQMVNSSVDEMTQINGFSDDMVLGPGMQIVIPKMKDSEEGYWYYTVKKGDNPYGIAKEKNVDYKTLLALNGLDDNDYIYPNQTLILPKEGFLFYMTQDNDTISDVMNRNHVEFTDLVKENEKIYLKPEQIIVFKQK